MKGKGVTDTGLAMRTEMVIFHAIPGCYRQTARKLNRDCGNQGQRQPEYAAQSGTPAPKK